MPLIVDKIQLTDFFRNGKYITFPVAYVAYIDENGLIRNIKGDVYTKLKSNNKIESLQDPKVDSDYYYDVIRTNVLLDCKDRIINPKKLVFLINNKLYDIFGREINPAQEIQIAEEDIKNIVEPDDNEDLKEVTNCNYIYCDFDNSVKDQKGNVSFLINGNEAYDSAFLFDGKTYIQANTNTLPNDWTLKLTFKQNKISDDYQSIVCFSKEGDNLFNVLTEKNDIYVYANNNLKFIDDLGDDIINKFNDIVITSNGDVYVAGILKTNVGVIDLSTANWNFILGGDYNKDGSVNNFYVGQLKEFGVCDYIVGEDKIKGIG